MRSSGAGGSPPSRRSSRRAASMSAPAARWPEAARWMTGASGGARSTAGGWCSGAPRAAVPGGSAGDQNHSEKASVATCRALLRMAAGNHASSRPTPSRDRAECARTPRREAALACTPTGWQRACGTMPPASSSGYVAGRPAARRPAPVCASQTIWRAGTAQPTKIGAVWSRRSSGSYGQSAMKASRFSRAVHPVFVEIEHRKTAGRIPATAAPPGKPGVERIAPRRVGHAPPDVVVRQRFAEQIHAQA